MSQIADKFQEVEFILALVVTAIITVAFKFWAGTNWVVSFIIASLIGGGLYILYQDYTEKERLKEVEKAKQDDLKRRIQEQAEEELKSGKCVSCTAEIPEGAGECPQCGYPVKHYSSVVTEE